MIESIKTDLSNNNVIIKDKTTILLETYNSLLKDLRNVKQGQHILDKEEPFLNEEQRFTLFPIIHEDIWEMHKKQEAAFWTAGEIDFSEDYKHWETLSDDYKWFIKHILAFFAGSDGIVNLNIMKNFSQDVPVFEAQVFYQFQSAIENIHSEVYSLMIESYIKDMNEKDQLFNAIKYIPCIQNKMKWAITWLKEDCMFARRIVAFAIVEGLFFSGSFCAIFWLKKQNILPGLTLSNTFIARDEGMHCNFACLLYSKLVNKLSEKEIHYMVQDAVEIERQFIIESLPCKLIGMNSDLMYQYITYVADRLVQMLGYNKIYNSTNPFEFMEGISIDSKENFFETRTTSYSKSSVINQGIQALTFTDDF